MNVLGIACNIHLICYKLYGAVGGGVQVGMAPSFACQAPALQAPDSQLPSLSRFLASS